MILVNAETMKRLDRKALREYGIKGIVLMENAGRAVSEAVKKKRRRLRIEESLHNLRQRK